MKQNSLILLISLFLTACTAGRPVPATQAASIPTLASPPPRPTATIPSSFPVTLSVQAATLPYNPAVWQTHWDEAGQFIIQYPAEASFYQNQRPVVDGGLAPAENTIAIQNSVRGNYILTLTYLDLAPGGLLTDFIDNNSVCVEVTSSAGSPFQLPGRPAGQIFRDTRCGAYNTSYLYLIHGHKGYRFTIVSSGRYETIEPHIQPILNSFQSFAPTSTFDLQNRFDQNLPAASLPVIAPDNADKLKPLARLGRGIIKDYALSPAGSTLVVATSPGLLIYQVDTLTRQRFIPADAVALVVAYSPDGQTLAAALADYSLRLWNVKTGQLQHTLSGHAGQVTRMVFSPDGRWLNTIAGDGTLRVWDLNTSRQAYARLVHPFSHLSFSPDGHWFALGGGKLNRTVQVLDLPTGRIVSELETQPDVLDMAFSPDSRTLALLPSGDQAAPLQLWDFLTGQVRRLRHASTLHSLAWSPDGTSLATGGIDRTVQVWDITLGAVSRVIGMHTSYVRELAFSPDGRYLASGDGSHIKIWELDTGNPYASLPQFTAKSLRFSTNAQHLAFQRGGTVGLVDLGSQQTRLLPGHIDTLISLAFSPDGSWLVAGDWTGLVHAWPMFSGQSPQVLDKHSGPVGSLAFSPDPLQDTDGRLLTTGGINQDHTVHLWQMPRTGETNLNTILPLTGSDDDPGYPLNSLIFLPGGRLLAGGDLTGISVRDLDLNEVRHFNGHTGPVLAVAISPDGTKIASGSFDETVIVWDLISGQQLLTLPGHKQGVASILFSPDGRWLITGDQQDVIRGWNIKTGQLQQSTRGRGVDLALNPAGTLLAFKKSLDTFSIGDLYSVREVAQFQGERPLHFSPDGRLLAVGSQAGFIVLWGIQ